jgi:invasion protein IalB
VISVARIMLFVVAFLGSSISAASAYETIRRPWEKFCLTSASGIVTCWIGTGIMPECLPYAERAATVVSERGAGERLKLTIPPSTGAPHIIGFTIDRGETRIARGNPSCAASGCSAEYPLDTDLVAKLKGGQMLLLSDADASGQVVAQLPLAGFSEAYGPPKEPKVFEKSASLLKAELEKHAAVGPCAPQ